MTDTTLLISVIIPASNFVQNLKDVNILRFGFQVYRKRSHRQDILFSCTDCHLLVVKTFKNYWEEPGDFVLHFQGYFLKKERK